MPGFASSTIVIAGFDSFAAAESAAHALVADGFREEAVSIFQIDTGRPVTEGTPRPWPRRMVYAAMVNTAALAVAGAAAGGTMATLVDISDTLGIAAAAVGALVGGMAGALIAVLQGRSFASSATQSRHAALVAVIAEAGEEPQSAQLLLDAGGVAVERMRGRFVRGNWASIDPMGNKPIRHRVSIQ
jgi:hypothetical protein